MATIDDGADAMTIMCHCIDCQKRSGSPFGVMAYYPNDSITIVGEAREYTRHHWLALPEATTGFVKGRDGQPSR
jgi:hypothetical protein